ncbi:MAG: type I-D CRISPR-associated protein Cas7/Csc2 [Desulfurococcaceae archaeon]
MKPLSMPESPVSRIMRFLEQNKNYFRESNEPDRVFAKGKKIEVALAIISKGLPLFRTEGVGDISLIDIAVKNAIISVPAILPEKLQAKLRRQMLEKLRESFDERTRAYIIEYKNKLKFEKIESDGSWNCYIAPPKEAGETDIGMCGFCPACNILGTIITKDVNSKASTSYGLKSRVVHDIAFGTVRYEKAIIDLTHTKVGDGVSYTGRSLFEESHVIPGVVFIGKLAMYDVTRREASLVLSALSSITRMGGGETKYGSVQTIVLGLKAGNRETISSYDMARYILEKYGGELVAPEEVLKTATEYISSKDFTVIIDQGKRIDELSMIIDVNKDEIAKIWVEDNYIYSKNVVEYIMQAEGEARDKSGARKVKEEE